MHKVGQGSTGAESQDHGVAVEGPAFDTTEILGVACNYCGRCDSSDSKYNDILHDIF